MGEYEEERDDDYLTYRERRTVWWRAHATRYYQRTTVRRPAPYRIYRARLTASHLPIDY
jgi:hypothetical protein